MTKTKDDEFFVTSWLRNRNTLEYIDIWEQVYNPIFNYVEFDIIKNQARLNATFVLSVRLSSRIYRTGILMYGKNLYLASYSNISSIASEKATCFSFFHNT
jgi:hypothetical protein